MTSVVGGRDGRARRDDGQVERDGKPTNDSKDWRLPDRKRFLTSLSAIAFFGGVGFATVVAIRKGRALQAAEEAAQSISKDAATSPAATAPASRSMVRGSALEGTVSANRTLPDEAVSSLEGATQKGPFALFREMNAAAFGGALKRQKMDTASGSSIASTSSPGVNALRKTAVPRSVFDAPQSAPPPSVLMRSAKPPTSSSTSTGNPFDMKAAAEREEEAENATASASSTKHAQAEAEDQGESPALVAIKALGIATALVGAGAYFFVEVSRRILGVRNTDELVEKLHELLPESMRDKQGLARVRQRLGPTVRIVRGAKEQEGGEEVISVEATDTQGDPMPLQEALDRLDEAAQRGETGEWAGVLNAQINAEVRQMVEERRSRLKQRDQKEQRNIP